jgi:hypothetical protein
MNSVFRITPFLASGARHLSGTATPRTPLIKFIGKRSLVAAKQSHAAAPAAMPVDPALAFSTGKGLNFYEMPAGEWHGRPRLYDAEIEAIESGGASVSFA